MSRTIPITRYPGYDVLNKRNSPSWDAKTRDVIAQRLALPATPQFFTEAEWRAVNALCDCLVPQSAGHTPPLAALVDHKLQTNAGDGYRDARLPPQRDAWRTALAALDEYCQRTAHLAFADLGSDLQIAILHIWQRGELQSDLWSGMPAQLFFTERLLHDICGGWYALPAAWSEMGFGGPANPRGYVRMNINKRDPWEPMEATPGQEEHAREVNQRVR